MKRRDLVAGLAAGGLAGLGGALAGCGPESESSGKARSSKRYRWSMVTTWPKNFPGLGSGAEYLAQSIGELTDGDLTINVYGAGERVPALEVFDAVSRGAFEMGHSAAYYWKGKAAAAPFFTAVPFGLIAQEMNGWLYDDDGLKLWRELYAKFNLVPFPAGNTGMQMGGWFKQELKSLDDLKGLKMRIPGLGGDVMRKLGVAAVNIPGGELFTALQSGTIDAAEWVGPYNDLAFGFQQAAKFYYGPGWQEPGPTLECIVHKPTYEKLPKVLQDAVATACAATNAKMLAEYSARNARALDTLVNKHGVQLRVFPDDIMAALHKAGTEVVDTLAASDPFAGKVYASYKKYRKSVIGTTNLAERAFLNARGNG